MEPLEVPVEPRSAAVEHVAAPVEPVLAPVDKGSSPERLQRPCLSPEGLPFLLATLPRYQILIMPDMWTHFVIIMILVTPTLNDELIWVQAGRG